MATASSTTSTPADSEIQTSVKTQGYWDAAAEVYARDFSATLLGRLQREAVWHETDRIFRAGQHILEVNCGTGIDAVRMASRGIRVTACDISRRMVEIAREHAFASGLADRAEFRVLPTEKLGEIAGRAIFDGGFSNFSGLNCVTDLRAAGVEMARLLKPGGTLLAVMLGRIVPWEVAWFFAHGKFERATRRWRGTYRDPNDADAPTVRYPNVREIAAAMAPEFTLRRWRGIGVTLPPTYLDRAMRRVPRTAAALARIDASLGAIPGIRALSNFAVLEFARSRNSAFRTESPDEDAR